MAKKDLDLFAIIVDALEYYHTYVAPTIKESTKRQNLSLLSEFKRFLDTLPKRDYSMAIFSQKGLNRYKKYLIDKMNKSKTDGKKKNFGVGQVNRCGSIIARLINQVLIEKYNDINPVVWNKVKDTRREDQFGHIPLLDEEVTAIENCIGLSDKDKEYRNIFLLHIECGQRVSDLGKLMMRKYKIEQGKKYKYIVISTQKENIKAYIPLTDRMKTMLERVQSLKLINPKDFDEKTKGKGNNTYNEAIKRIAQLAVLDRVIVKTDSVGNVHEKLLHETITSHDARCTFITNMIKKGVKPDVLCKMTGHASDEMIKRVYAQLTEHQEISRIESDLFTDIVDYPNSSDVALSSKSNEPITEPQGETHSENTATLPHINMINNDSSKQFNLEKYIKELNDIVDSSISNSESWLNNFQDFAKEAIPFFEMGYNELKNQMIKERINSKEDIIKQWNDCLEYCEKTKNDLADNKKGFEDGYKLIFLSVLMDYCKEHHLGEDLLLILDGFYAELCEENPIVCNTYKMLHLGEEIISCAIVLNVSNQAFYYIFLNRPKVASLIIDGSEKRFMLNRFPDVHIVINELQNIPANELQAIIQKMDFDFDNKVRLYQSIVNGNLELFSEFVKSSEHKLSGLIESAYLMNFKASFLKKFDDSFKEDSNPIKGFVNMDEFILHNIPFFDLDVNMHGMFNKMVEIDFVLSQMDRYIESFEILKNDAFPEEKRIINKILRLVDKYPKLKKAYEEYKAKQNTSPDSKQTEDVGVLQNAGNELEKTEGPKDPKDLKKEPKDKGKVDNTIPSKRNIDVDKLIELLTEDNDLNGNNCLITLLECDNNDADVKSCLKHFLGYKSQEKSQTPLSFKLRWNRDHMLGLKFLIRLLLNSNTEATRENVIKYEIVNGVPKPYDGISKEFVSDGKGQTGIWPSVREVFPGCKSIMQAGLGQTESAWKKNKKQLEIVADIYFECKK